MKMTVFSPPYLSLHRGARRHNIPRDIMLVIDMVHGAYFVLETYRYIYEYWRHRYIGIQSLCKRKARNCYGVRIIYVHTRGCVSVDLYNLKRPIF